MMTAGQTRQILLEADMRTFAVLVALAVTVSSSATPPPIMHRFIYPMCIAIPDRADDRFAQTEDHGGWFRRPPCRAGDIGWIDENQVAHFQSDRARLELALVKMLGEFCGLPVTLGR
jgi:hypothetical protein